jgi:membrane protein implicated in regulation of membrane protease activity
MPRATRRTLFAVAFLALCVAPLILVGVKYWLWERTLHANETGHRTEMSLAGRTYTEVFEAFYLHSTAVARPLAKRLPVGGVAIDLAADLVAVVLQNICLLFLWRLWQARRHRSKDRAPATNET